MGKKSPQRVMRQGPTQDEQVGLVAPGGGRRRDRRGDDDGAAGETMLYVALQRNLD